MSADFCAFTVVWMQYGHLHKFTFSPNSLPIHTAINAWKKITIHFLNKLYIIIKRLVLSLFFFMTSAIMNNGFAIFFSILYLGLFELKQKWGTFRNAWTDEIHKIKKWDISNK